MIRPALYAVALFLLACTSTDPDDSGATVAAGMYQHAETIDGIALVLQIDLKASQDYAARGFVGGLAGCAIFEENGKWAAEAGKLRTYSANARDREGCAAEFSAWASRPDESRELRNVTAASFELYQPQDDESPAQWVKYSKL